MDSATYRCGSCLIDPGNRSFTRAGSEISLEPKVFAVILQLLSKPGALVTRDELLDAVWGHRYVTRSTLNRVIALARRAFEDDSEEPRFIQTLYGSGYKFVGPFEKHSAPNSDQAARFAPPPSMCLPARIDSLIGRSAELGLLARLFDEHRAVTVLGSGGIGKTQCSLAFARSVADEFPDGVWFVDLAPMNHAHECLGHLGASLGIPPMPLIAMLQELVAVFRPRRLLLVLDNCDRLAAQVGAWVIELLRGTEALQVLATSQAPLNFLGEQLMRLPPLALPRVDAALSWQEIAAAPAVEMLLARVRAVQPGFVVSVDNVHTLAEICVKLDGLPLALELAAARFALLTPEQVLERLDQRFRFLSSTVAGRDGRHRNLLVLLDWSFSLLSTEEQRLLTWFGVFVHGWTVEAAVDLAAASGCDAESAIDLLSGLVDKSLVSVDPSLSPPRYRLLETVREYALARLQAGTEEVAARDAHLQYVVNLCRATHADIVGGRMRERIELMIHEHPNIAAAVEYAASASQRRTFGLDIAGHLMFYIKGRGLYHEGPEWCRRALKGTETLQSEERGRALMSMGVGAVYRQEDADAFLVEAMHIAQLHRNRWIEAYASAFHSLWLTNVGRMEEAAKEADFTTRIAGQLGEPTVTGLAALARAWVHMGHCDFVSAISIMEPWQDEGYDLHQRHFLAGYIGLAQFGLNDYANAARSWLKCMRASINIINVRGVAAGIEGCGYLAARLGQDLDAVRLMSVAMRIRVRTKTALFRLWRVHHDATQAALRARMSPAEFSAATEAALAIRDEDAANEAGVHLSRFANAQVSRNKPVGS